MDGQTYGRLKGQSTFCCWKETSALPLTTQSISATSIDLFCNILNYNFYLSSKHIVGFFICFCWNANSNKH